MIKWVVNYKLFVKCLSFFIVILSNTFDLIKFVFILQATLSNAFFL